MKKIGFRRHRCSGLSAAIIGLAGPGAGGREHHEWLDRIHPVVSVPQVDTTVSRAVESATTAQLLPAELKP